MPGTGNPDNPEEEPPDVGLVYGFAAEALGIPGEGVMGLVGPAFVAGTAALVFLLAAEVVAGHPPG